MEMRCYRRLLHISYKDHITNEVVSNETQAAIGPYEEIVPTPTRLKAIFPHCRVRITWSPTSSSLHGWIRGCQSTLTPFLHTAVSFDHLTTKARDQSSSTAGKDSCLQQYFFKATQHGNTIYLDGIFTDMPHFVSRLHDRHSN